MTHRPALSRTVDGSRGDPRTLSHGFHRGKRFGEVAVIVAMVGVQFVDLTFASVRGVDISLQKLVSVVVLSFGVLLMGRIYFSPTLVGIGFLFLLSLSSSLLTGVPNPGLPNYLVTATLAILAATILLTALIQHPSNTRLFCMTWIYFALLSAVITVFQSVGLVPLFTVPQDIESLRFATEGFIRGTGLKGDPNFQAVMLVIGLGFTRFFIRSTARLVCSLVILAGVLSTLSRMGTIIALFILLVTSGAGHSVALNARSGVTRFVRAVTLSGVSVVMIFAAYLLSLALPSQLRAYWADRVSDTTESVQRLISGDIDYSAAQESSGLSHAFQLEGSWDVFRENWLFGVGGGGRMEDALYQAGYGLTPAHNSYLELMGVGGVMGIITLLAIVVAIFKALRPGNGRGIRSAELSAARLTMFSFAIACLFITFLYNSLFWVLLAFCLGAARCRDRPEVVDGEIGRNGREDRRSSGSEPAAMRVSLPNIHADRSEGMGGKDRID